MSTFTETVRTVVRSYATRGYNTVGEKNSLLYVENEQDQVFAVLAPYDPGTKSADLVLMTRIIDDRVVIEADKTSVSVKDELRHAGVANEQIVLAWRRPG